MTDSPLDNFAEIFLKSHQLFSELLYEHYDSLVEKGDATLLLDFLTDVKANEIASFTPLCKYLTKSLAVGNPINNTTLNSKINKIMMNVKNEEVTFDTEGSFRKEDKEVVKNLVKSMRLTSMENKELQELDDYLNDEQASTEDLNKEETLRKLAFNFEWSLFPNFDKKSKNICHKKKPPYSLIKLPGVDGPQEVQQIPGNENQPPIVILTKRRNKKKNNSRDERSSDNTGDSDNSLCKRQPVKKNKEKNTTQNQSYYY